MIRARNNAIWVLFSRVVMVTPVVLVFLSLYQLLPTPSTLPSSQQYANNNNNQRHPSQEPFVAYQPRTPIQVSREPRVPSMSRPRSTGSDNSGSSPLDDKESAVVDDGGYDCVDGDDDRRCLLAGTGDRPTSAVVDKGSRRPVKKRRRKPKPDELDKLDEAQPDQILDDSLPSGQDKVNPPAAAEDEEEEEEGDAKMEEQLPKDDAVDYADDTQNSNNEYEAESERQSIEDLQVRLLGEQTAGDEVEADNSAVDLTDYANGAVDLDNVEQSSDENENYPDQQQQSLNDETDATSDGQEAMEVTDGDGFAVEEQSQVELEQETDIDNVGIDDNTDSAEQAEDEISDDTGVLQLDTAADEPIVADDLPTGLEELVDVTYDGQAAAVNTDDVSADTRPNAYVTLCARDVDVFNTLVLFEQLRRVGSSRGEFAAMVIHVSDENIQLLNSAGIATLPIPEELQNTKLGYLKEGAEPTGRDLTLWNKLYVWTFTQYNKILLVDTDMVIVKNIDALFNYDELAGSPMVDPGEKILFYDPAPAGANSSVEAWFSEPWHKLSAKYKDPAEAAGVGKVGLNSGLIILQPSLATYDDMRLWVSRLKHRPCCPTQEFLYRYFEAQGKYTRIPPEYHVRRIKAIRPVFKAMLLRRTAKVYHYVSRSKPLDILRPTQDRILKIWQRDALIVRKQLLHDPNFADVPIPPPIVMDQLQQQDDVVDVVDEA